MDVEKNKRLSFYYYEGNERMEWNEKESLYDEIFLLRRIDVLKRISVMILRRWSEWVFITEYLKGFRTSK